MYAPLTQLAEGPFQSAISLTLRASAGSPALLTRSVAEAASGVDRGLALTFRTLSDYLDASLVQERVVAMIAGFFGALALPLAGLGLYGVTSYAVTRRRPEIGVRMALGASANAVMTLVLSRVAVLVGVGAAVGAAISVWAARFVAPLLYGLQPTDATTLIGAVLVLGTVGGIAGWIPARRAARVDPASVLRES